MKAKSKAKKTKAKPVLSSQLASAATALAARTGDFEELGQLIRAMNKHRIAELEWSNGKERLRLRAHEGRVSGKQISAPVYEEEAPVQVAAPAVVAEPAAAPVAPVETGSNLKQVKAPFVGTFYRSASPGSDPYVREGQLVQKGDTLCIIEAMKLMNEIECEYTGKIVSVFVENGQPVEFGEPLFVVEI